jgi:hypothetical protein
MSRVYRDSGRCVGAGMSVLAVVLCLAMSGRTQAARAGTAPWTAGGYLKDLLAYSDVASADSADAPGRWQNTAQVRLNLHWYPTRSLTATLESRHLLVLEHNIGAETGYGSLAAPQTDYYFDLEGIETRKNSLMTTAIDRLYADWTHGSLEVTAGRQRIAWGTCLVWNPLDLFNPYGVLDFDYEEKPGTDALRVQVYTGAVSTVEIAGGPGRTASEVTYGIRYLTGLKGYDLSVVAGWEKRFWRVGTGWAGQIAGGGFRGEVLYSTPGETIVLGPEVVGGSLGGTVHREAGDFWTAALSYDYTFANSFYVHDEVLYNGLGTTRSAGLRYTQTAITGELSPARYSIFHEFAYDITPLLRADIFAILNPDDRSWISISTLAYSLSANWEVSAYAIPSGG